MRTNGGFLSGTRLRADLGEPAGGVGVEVRFDRALYDDRDFERHGISFPERLGRAVASRRAEYLAGRIAAAHALAAIGIRGAQIGSGAHREPLWPAGVSGSISHSAQTALCVVARRPDLCLGIDVERIVDDTLRGSISTQVLRADERPLSASAPKLDNAAFTAAFSAKESLFKALFPVVGRFFGFEAARVRALDLDEGSMQLELAVDLASFRAGTAFDVAVGRERDEIVTLIAAEAPRG